MNTTDKNKKQNGESASGYPSALKDIKYMKLALKLAKKGAGTVSPNPLVGAVIEKNGKIIGTGYHRKAGMAHAEIEAFSSCRDKNALKGAVLYVTLEPCSIYGRTPPCTDAIINNKISRVVIATADPNPGINGKGMEKLKLAGIEITSGILRKSAEKQNEIFFKHITKGAPFITSKIAASLDGKTAAGTGSSKWITSEKSRCAAKKMRFEFDCILTGIGTVLADDPLLVPEGFKNLASLKNSGKKYLRAVLDSSLNIPATSKIAESSGNIDTIIFISENLSGDRALKEKKKTLEEKGIKIAAVPGYGNNFLDLKKILKILHDRFEITSIFLECGQTLFTEFLKNGLIDKFIFFVAPKLIGGDSGFGIVSSLGIRDVPEAPFLQIDSIKKSGQDIMITAYPGKEKSVYRSH